MESDVSGAGVSGSAEVTLGAGTLAATGVADLPIELAGGTIGVSLASGFDGAELVAALALAGGSRLTLTAAAARSGSGYAVTAEAAAGDVPLKDLATPGTKTCGGVTRES